MISPRALSPHFAVVGLLLFGLFGATAVGCQASTEASPAAESAASPAAEPAAAPPTEPMTALAMPAWTDDGPDLEHQVLFESGGLKIAAIVLRRGKPLPTHTATARVSISVLRGRGQLTVGDEVTAVESGSVVVLAPEAPHAVHPAGEEPMLLLVHYFPH